MVLVDTSVWIDFFVDQKTAPTLPSLLLENEVVCHPWVFGEILVGRLGKHRQRILADLRVLPQTAVYPVGEIAEFVEKEKLFGQGVSFIDIQLLYATIAGDNLLWTHDRRLQRTARRFGRAYVPNP